MIHCVMKSLRSLTLTPVLHLNLRQFFCMYFFLETWLERAMAVEPECGTRGMFTLMQDVARCCKYLPMYMSLNVIIFS